MRRLLTLREVQLISRKHLVLNQPFPQQIQELNDQLRRWTGILGMPERQAQISVNRSPR